MKTKVCVICGKTFHPTGRQKLCSPECQHENERRRLADKVYFPTCIICGKQFAASYPKKLYCSPECSKEGNSKAAEERAQLITDGVCKEVPCEICGKIFRQKTTRQKCCSNECSRKRNRKKARERQREISAIRIEQEVIERPAEPEVEEDSLIRVNAKARNAGMSYGQYVAQQYMERMRRQNE